MMKGQRKKKVRIGDEIEVDRISGLPESILSHILCFLDTKTALRTCVLSKRWRLVWTSVPNLDFQYGPMPLCEKSAHNTASFTAFVDHVLALRDNSHLTTFRFSVHYDVNPVLVEDCINYAFRHNVQHLKIRAFCSRRPVELPPPHLLSACQSLRVLKLTTATPASLALPKAFALPALNTLQLKNFTFSDENSNGEIFTGCPNLQSLVLRKCGIRPRDKLKAVNVSGLRLRYLEILYWRCPWDYFFDQSIVISSPGLASFKYKGPVSPLCFKQELLCIEEVCIDMCCPSSCATIDVNDRMLRTAESLISMLAELCNLKSLTLSFNTLEILSAIPNLKEFGPSTFGNLRYLRFKAEDKYSEMKIAIDAMTNLLKSSDSGEILTLDRPKEHKLYNFGDLKYEKKKSRRQSEDVVAIPVDVMSYLLWSSPSAETLVIEFPEAASEEE